MDWCLAAAPRDVAVSRQEGPAAWSRETLDVAPANIAQIPRATVLSRARTVASDLRGALCYNHYLRPPAGSPQKELGTYRNFSSGAQQCFSRTPKMTFSETKKWFKMILGD